jgi:uncharacterized protein HemX
MNNEPNTNVPVAQPETPTSAPQTEVPVQPSYGTTQPASMPVQNAAPGLSRKMKLLIYVVLAFVLIAVFILWGMGEQRKMQEAARQMQERTIQRNSN